MQGRQTKHARQKNQTTSPPNQKLLQIPPIVCLFVALCLSGQDPRSTLVETPLQIGLFYAKQTQFQNGQYKHKYSKYKGLCQRTTNNEQRTLFKTNPIKPNSTPLPKSQIPFFGQRSPLLAHLHPAACHWQAATWVNHGAAGIVRPKPHDVADGNSVARVPVCSHNMAEMCLRTQLRTLKSRKSCSI